MAIITGTVLWVNATAQMVRAEDGKAIYDKNCAMCHGPGGKGDGPAGKALKPPPGDFATTAKAMAAADIEKMVKEGSKEAGKTHAAFGKKLSDEQIKAVAQHVKDLAK